MPHFYLSNASDNNSLPLPDTLIQTDSTGTPQLMILLVSLEALRRARLDIPRFIKTRANSDFFGGPHLFYRGGLTETGDTFARHLDAPLDLMEDPFTGSATGGMAAYLWRYGLIESPTFVAEQGHWMDRPGQTTVEVVGLRDDIETVKVGGGAVTVLRGEFVL
ncbi:MAG: PhzF family phenazine biosynthesis protein [Anaerolineae bacterium]|nr:PhzF family phenazine biosynthesis protein [Anaerolineae bacterium]